MLHGWLAPPYNHSMAKQREVTHAQNPAMLEAGQRGDVLVWRQVSSLLYTRDGTPVRVGLPGMADAGMVVAVTITPDMVGRVIGVAVQAEFKADTGRQSEAQRNWQAAVQRRGGVYRLVRCAADMAGLIEDVQHGRW